MPRPKRAKVASVVPATRVATFAAMSQSTSEVQNDVRRRQKAEQAKSNKSSRPTVNKPAATTARAKTKSDAQATSTPDVSAMERLKRRRQEALQTHSPIAVDVQAQAPPLPDNKGLSRRDATAAATGVSSLIHDLGSPGSLRHGTPKSPTRDTSDDLYGLSPEGEKSQRLLLKGYKAREPQPMQSSALKTNPTPTHEASILALKHFKRRSRKPSILRSHRASMQSALNLDSDMEGFNPDDESTPLRLRGEGVQDSSLQAELARSSGSRKRTFSQYESDVRIPESSPPLNRVDDPIALMRDTIELAPNGSSELASETSDLPAYVPETAAATQNVPEEIWSQTMAPPKSSSSLEDNTDMQPESPGRQQARERTAATDATEKLSKRKTRSRSAKNKPQALSTAALQDLLPQRRKRLFRKGNADTFEIPSDSDADASEPSSADELSKTRKRNAKTVRRKAQPSTSRNLGIAKTAVHNFQAQKGQSGKTATPNSLRKTYGRQSNTSDKENDDSVFDPDLDDSIQDEIIVGAAKRTARESKELRAVAEKFAAVDEWEMEFESVDASGEGSSWR